MIKYIIDVHIVWSIFLLAYFLFFSKTTFFRHNRLYLLFTIFLGLVLPVLNFNLNPQTVTNYNLQQIVVVASKTEKIVPIISSYSPSFKIPLIAIFSLGVLYRFIMFIFSLFKILKTTSKKAEIINGTKVIITNEKHEPYSFLDKTFLSTTKNYSDEQLNQIIIHEKTHIEEKHSYDNIILEVLNIIFWFSPLIYIYKHSLKMQHEFIADTAALKHTKRNDYLDLLQFQMNLFSSISIANNFYYSPLKSRLMMIFKTPTKHIKKYMYLIIIPLLSISFLLVSCEHDTDTPGLEVKTNKEVVTITALQSSGNKDVFKVVEDMPRFAGCEDISDVEERKDCSQNKMLKYIYTNIVYPKNSRINGIYGTSIVSFIVEKDGSISNVKVVREIATDISEECLRVVNSMPKWIPGKQDGKTVRVQFNLPIRFKLE